MEREGTVYSSEVFATSSSMHLTQFFYNCED